MFTAAILEERNNRMIFLWEINFILQCKYGLLFGSSNMAAVNILYRKDVARVEHFFGPKLNRNTSGK